MNKKNTYLIIGNGRVAKHLTHYLNLLNVNFLSWSRSQSDLKNLEVIAKAATHILICTKDSAIQEIANLRIFADKIKIHFSGSMTIPDVFSIHPLMTFSNELYPNDQYPKIPFIIDESAPDLKTLIPELTNPVYRINEKLRPLYHALCVTGGNFTTMLWQMVFEESLKKLNLPKEAYSEFLNVTVKNVLTSPDTALTGPFIRSDVETIELNKKSLAKSELLSIYQAFENSYARPNKI